MTHLQNRLLPFLLLLTISVGCSSTVATSPNEEDQIAKAVRERIDSMSLREKVGQMFFIRPEALSDGVVTEFSDTIAARFAKYPCGGFCLFAYNCVDSIQLTRLDSCLHALPDRPLVCIDEEGGRVLRIASNPSFALRKTPNMTLTAQKGEHNVRESAAYIGSYLSRFGIDVDFAPVADVNSNPDSPVIGTRAFSENPDTAARMVCAYIDGLQRYGIISCLKHYPGHGEAKTDSHLGYADSKKSWEQMMECELIPFKAGIEKGVPMIMVAHITAPQVDTNCVPSTLSRVLVEEKLRGELGYEGLIVTDGLGMGAITQNYSPAQAAITAIKAGVDIVLLPQDYKEAFDAVEDAVSDGEISLERIETSVSRILSVKMKYNKPTI